MWSQKKIKNYLLFSISEVILVVIGILIAVQTNNWNENKKKEKNKYEFLVHLKEEISLDTLQLSAKIKSFKNVNETVFKGMLLLEKTHHTEIEKNDFEMAMNRTRVLTPLNKNTNRNDNKISSGIIANNELNNLLLEYYEKIDYHKEVMTKFGETLQLMYLTQISPFVKFRHNNKAEYSLKALKGNNAFNNAFHISLGSRRQSIRWLEDQKGEAIELLNTIDKQILLAKPMK
jgi:hypothetical protein